MNRSKINRQKRWAMMLLLVSGIVFTLGQGSVTVAQETTRVLVIGTVHQRHRSDQNYSYEDIIHILHTYDPDAVCVEIRPKDFGREPYLKEMMMATVWGVANKKNVYPIDWWDDSNDRDIRDSLSLLPEYKEKENRLKSLEEASTVISEFEKKYGTWRNQGQQGYEFWNGKEYNSYIDEAYRLSMQVYGDSPFNLHYRARNDSMMVLIMKAVRENRGKKVIVLTGAEHKHYFDKVLEATTGVNLIQLETLLPLKKREMEPVIKAFFDEENDLMYYSEGYPSDFDRYFEVKMIDLVHGPDMDSRPEIVPSKNVPIAEKVLARWRRHGASSAEAAARMVFEEGWINFLKRDYLSAIRSLSSLLEKIDSGEITDAFVRVFVHRNIGFCYDLVGEREKAIRSYEQGKMLVRGTRYEGREERMFKDYTSRPYERPPSKN